jgi:hypothetical protein
MSFSKDSEDNSAQVSVKAKVMEVLDAIHSSPRSSPVPSGQVMPKEVVEAKCLELMATLWLLTWYQNRKT